MTHRLQHNYISDLISWISDTLIWEITITLSADIASDKWFIIIDKWINLKEERLFFHRRDNTSSNIVYVYWVNRSSAKIHDAWAKVILDAISSINYTLDNLHEQFYIYKKTLSEVIIVWGRWFRNWIWFTVADIDTSLWVANQVLALNTTNYVYVSEWVLYITDTDDGAKYIIWEIDVSDTWNVIEIRKIKAYTFEWDKWDAWSTIESAGFIWDDIVFTKDDSTDITIVDGKADLRVWNTDWNTIWNTVWNTVGNIVGNTTDNTVWNTVWNDLNNTVWNTVWNDLNNTDWNTTWNTTWNTIGNDLNNTDGNTLGNDLNNTVWNTVGNTTGNTLNNDLNNTAWNTVWNDLNNTAWNTVWNTTGNTTDNTAWNTDWNTLNNDLNNTDWNTVWNDLNNTDWNTVWNTIGNDLNNTAWNTVWNDLNNTDWNTVWNTVGNTTDNTIWNTADNTVGNTIWTLQWKGEWIAWAYLLNDWVSHFWESYVANVNTNTEPPGVDWDIAAKKGVDSIGTIVSVVWWDHISIDNTDPDNPIINTASLTAEHSQWISQAIWSINHWMNYYPAWIIVIDSWWTNIVNFNITYTDTNNLTLEFSWAMTWTVYLS